MIKNIALVTGGYSGEYVISVQSATLIREHLDPAVYQVYLIMISRESWNYTDPDGNLQEVDKNDFSLRLDGRKILFEAAFMAIHGTPGEDGRLQGYFDMIGLPYTGCGVVTSSLTFNKHNCNQVVNNLDIVRVADAALLQKDQDYHIQEILRKIGLPCIVKPNEGGSSIGISKVTDEDDLLPAIRKAFAEDSQVLVEKFIPGREFTCGLYRHGRKLIVLPVTEIISNHDFFDYEAKYTPGKSREITPASIPDSLKELIIVAARGIYSNLNCKGIIRIDFIFREATEELYFLEVNTMPGQTANSLVPQQVRAAGISLREVYGQLIRECMEERGQ